MMETLTVFPVLQRTYHLAKRAWILVAVNRLCTHHRAKHCVRIKTTLTLRKTRSLVVHVVWPTSLPLWVKPLWKSGLPKVSRHPQWFSLFLLGVKDSPYTFISNSQWHASE